MASPKRRGLARGRKKQGREKRKRHLIVSNGKVTEAEYFESVIEEMNVRGCVRYKYIDGDPLTVVKRLTRELALDKKVERLKEIEPFSSIWIVVDTDEFKNLAKAEREGDGAGYNFAISNPCFEVWLIDHDSPCPETCATAIQCASRARGLGILKSTDPKRSSADKFKSVSLDSVRGKYQTAVDNASKHNTATKSRARKCNPDKTDAYAVWTDIPELMEEVFGVNGH